jgi:hypothetical protein
MLDVGTAGMEAFKGKIEERVRGRFLQNLVVRKVFHNVDIK